MKKIVLESVKIILSVILTLIVVLPGISFKLNQQQDQFCELLLGLRSVDMQIGTNISDPAVSEKINDSAAYCYDSVSLWVDMDNSANKVKVGNGVFTNSLYGYYRIGENLQIRFVNKDDIVVNMTDLTNVVRKGDVVHIVFSLVPPENYVFWSDPANGLWITIKHISSN